MISFISPSTRLDSTRLDPTRLGAESRTKHDALSETGSECTKALVGLLSRPGPPLETDPLADPKGLVSPSYRLR